MRHALVALIIGASVAPCAAFSATSRTADEKTIVTHYLSALAHRKYDDAYRLLIDKERQYYRSPANFASIFTTDDLHIATYKIVGSKDAGSLGSVWLVRENVSFLDHAHQTHGTATVTVPYGVIVSGSSYRIKDPFHPWKAIRPSGAETVSGGLRVTIRKLSFFPDRIEALLTFANVTNGFVTLLPYGRSVLRDESGRVYHPIATRSPALTDKPLYLGLRLASSAQYTGAINFGVSSSHQPRRLQLTLAPMLRDGADAPFEVALPAVDVPQ